MRLDKYKITAYRCEWNTNTNLSDVNLFSNITPRKVIEIDLKPYIIKIDKLNFSFDNSDREGGTNTFYFETSDIKYTVTGIRNNRYLQSFFGLFEDTTYIKWKIELVDISQKNGNILIHRGLVSQELLNEEFSASPDSEQIKITALGFEKEFKEYYSGKILPHNDTEIQWTSSVLNSLIQRRDGYDRWHITIPDLFNQLFNNPLVKFEYETGINGITNWCMIKNPFLGKMNNGNDLWIKNSYERIRTGGCSRFNLLEKLCNAMGWVFYFYSDKLYIKNRSSAYDVIYNLDFNRFMDWKISKSSATVEFDNIVILDGDLFGGNGSGGGDQRGARFCILTNQDYVGANPEIAPKYCGRWWKRIGGSDGSGWHLQYRPAGWRLQRYWNDKDDNWTYNIREYTNGTNYGAINHTISKDDTLFIDGGDTGISGWAYQSGTDGVRPMGANFPTDDHKDAQGNLYNDELSFRANYGNACFKYIYGLVIPYEDYVGSDIFTNNFSKFFNSKRALKLSVKYPEIITNPIQNFVIQNCPNNKLVGTWTINSMSVDFFNEETELDLQLKLE